MDISNYIVKARPGVLGGKHEEKRPLRQLSALPVKRHVFINRDSHPDADIYVAIHEAKDLPSPVPDYQVPHCHNTDEFTILSATMPISPASKGKLSSKVKCTRSFRRLASTSPPAPYMSTK